MLHDFLDTFEDVNEKTEDLQNPQNLGGLTPIEQYYRTLDLTLDKITRSNLVNEAIIKHKIVNLGNLKVHGLYLIDVPPFYEKVMSNEFREALLTDQVSYFDENLTGIDYDLLVLACQYNKINLIMFCLSKKIGLRYLTNVKTSAFTYACYHGLYQVAEIILEENIDNKSFLNKKDKNRKLPVEYIRSAGFKQIIEITIRDTLVDENYDFTIFQVGDFGYVDGDEILACGGYGRIQHVVDIREGPSKGRDMILKKYSDCGDPSSNAYYEVIDPSSGREISILLMLNKLIPDISVKLYGFYIENGCFFLVLEYLPLTLNFLFKQMKQYSLVDRVETTKMITNEMINVTHMINSLGINHNDMKDLNIMINRNGKLKVIDFGLSQFLGLEPQLQYRNQPLGTEYIMAPDGSGIKIGAPGIDNLGGRKPGVRTLNSDIYSIGVEILNQIYDTVDCKYISNGTIIARTYKMLFGNGEKFKVCDEDVLIPYGAEFTQLLKLMVHYDSRIRPFANQCREILDRGSLTYIDVQISAPVESTTHAIYREINNELVYVNEIIESTKEFSLVAAGSNHANSARLGMLIAKTVIEIYRNYCGNNIDILLNAIPKILSSIDQIDLNLGEQNKTRRGKTETEILVDNYIAAHLIIGGFQFLESPKSVKSWTRDFPQYTNIITNVLTKISENHETFMFTPVRTHVAYIKFLLQCVGESSAKIEEITSKIYRCLIANAFMNFERIEIHKLVYAAYRVSGGKKIPQIDRVIGDDPELMMRLINAANEFVKFPIEKHDLIRIIRGAI